ncbi:hypothetical protein BSY18_4137 (plasmid) [Blastomonas sp. RAC04]|nr:hypothetical protein BSY18_4137 [Blastomonas sp. RAC04]
MLIRVPACFNIGKHNPRFLPGIHQTEPVGIPANGDIPHDASNPLSQKKRSCARRPNSETQTRDDRIFDLNLTFRGRFQSSDLCVCQTHRFRSHLCLHGVPFWGVTLGNI